MTPEQRARENIDKQLIAAGWILQDYREMNPGAGVGIAVREYPTDTGPVDYLLMVDRVHVGVVEAKPAGTVLSKVETQAERYAVSEIKWRVGNEPLPFVYESTGEETRFTDMRDPKPRARDIFNFHRPETLAAWHAEAKTLRARLLDLPALDHKGLRQCQIVAIDNLEKSLKEARPRALVQMATGSGKTYTAITAVYRYLKFAKGKRVLFLVDTRNLGRQAEQEFQAYTPQDDSRKFTELYNVQRLRSGTIDPSSQVCVSTIQRMYSILRGEELDESAEEHSVGEAALKQMRDVVYNATYPPEFFDLIIIDECHRSIYNVWKQVLDYFDAFMVGLTATPDARTYGFFNQNVVSEYTHEEAVVDGVNVGYDVYRIKTAVGEQGGQIEAGEWVDKRSRLTRRKRWEQVDEDVIYPSSELDRSVVNPNQIRTVIREFKRVLPSLFPDRFTDKDGKQEFEVPKTLVFAKTDSHADDIITIIREEFAEGNAFCRKITYNAENPEQTLSDFRNDYNPRIAVTVDMVATGTDVKPLECLLFMRDVRSENYFEQMKGRGTRVLSGDDLKKVSSAAHAKTHFVIVDAVGVTESPKQASRPLERRPSVSMKALLMQAALGVRDEDTLTSLGNRLARLDRELEPAERERIAKVAGGKSPADLARALLDAYDLDIQADRAKQTTGAPEPDEAAIAAAAKALVTEACAPFDDPKLRDLIETVRQEHDQIIDKITPDSVLSSGTDAQALERAKATVQKFKDFIAKHRDDVVALQIFYSQPYNKRHITYAMAKELAEQLKDAALPPQEIWYAFRMIEGPKVKPGTAKTLPDVVALVRHAIEPQSALAPFREEVEERFAGWLAKMQKEGKTFTPAQIDWLTLIKDHIATSLEITKDDLDLPPLVQHGGLAGVYEVFGEGYEEILTDLQRELATV
ncbi:MAG TPA: DEAD/DEAH box helicase family protein [Candidatus Paceibacterota bacterium]|nr:DEAD/DEAH box helicase family protein [Candidatus Paceibacterota bacterium]